MRDFTGFPAEPGTAARDPARGFLLVVTGQEFQIWKLRSENSRTQAAMA
jgi:hypothetical protein